MPVANVGDLAIHYLTAGQGPALVLLHGFPLDSSMWRHQMTGLSDRFTVIAPDLRGFGRTGGAGETTTMDQFADDVAGLMDAIGLQDGAAVCGLSMGGYVAFALLRRHPEKIRSLILCDTRAVPDTPDAAAKRRETAAAVLKDGPRIVADAMLPKLFGSSTNEVQPQVVDAVRNQILAGSSRGIAAALNGMAQRPDSVSTLKNIQVPTLLVVGEEDAISPVHEMRDMAEQISDARFVVLPQAGHLSPLEQGDLANTAIREFLIT